MTTSGFPQAVDVFTTKIDGSTDVLADHVNYPQSALVNIETYLRSTRFEENLLACSLTYDESWLGGTSFANRADDNYGPTLWNILNSADPPDVNGIAGGSVDPFTRYLSITPDATTYFGAVQFIEAPKSKAYRGAVVSLSADLWATGITAARMAVIVWTSTADTLTSDVVGTWAAGNPTLASNWAYIGTPADITISTTRTRCSVQNLTIPTNANNLGVFIWLPAQEASGDVLNIARVKLEPGAAATDFIGRDPGNELKLIERYYEKTFAIGTTPANGIIAQRTMGAADATFELQCEAFFKTRKRIAPTITLFRGNVGATNGTWSNYIAPAWADPTTSDAVDVDTIGFYVRNTKVGAYVVGDAHLMMGHYVADCRL